LVDVRGFGIVCDAPVVAVERPDHFRERRLPGHGALDEQWSMRGTFPDGGGQLPHEVGDLVDRAVP